MKLSRLVPVVAAALLSAFSLPAQENPGNIEALEFQTPRPGMTKQYEEGRKQKADWHRQQKDSQPLLVWQTMSGDNAGTYIVGRVGQHWSDFDNPSVSDAADLEEYNKVLAASVQSAIPRYYEFLPKVSNPVDTPLPSKMEEVISFHVRSGKADDFESAIGRIHFAAERTHWPPRYEWYVLVNGGTLGEYVLLLPRPKWADFEEKPDVKPFRKMLEEAFPQAEADSIVKTLDASIESEYSDIVEFRQDLSYIPSP